MWGYVICQNIFGCLIYLEVLIITYFYDVKKDFVNWYGLLKIFSKIEYSASLEKIGKCRRWKFFLQILSNPIRKTEEKYFKFNWLVLWKWTDYNSPRSLNRDIVRMGVNPQILILRICFRTSVLWQPAA